MHEPGNNNSICILSTMRFNNLAILIPLLLASIEGASIDDNASAIASPSTASIPMVTRSQSTWSLGNLFGGMPLFRTSTPIVAEKVDNEPDDDFILIDSDENEQEGEDGKVPKQEDQEQHQVQQDQGQEKEQEQEVQEQVEQQQEQQQQEQQEKEQ